MLTIIVCLRSGGCHTTYGISADYLAIYKALIAVTGIYHNPVLGMSQFMSHFVYHVCGAFGTAKSLILYMTEGYHF